MGESGECFFFPHRHPVPPGLTLVFALRFKVRASRRGRGLHRVLARLLRCYRLDNRLHLRHRSVCLLPGSGGGIQEHPQEACCIDSVSTLHLTHLLLFFSVNVD